MFYGYLQSYVFIFPDVSLCVGRRLREEEEEEEDSVDACSEADFEENIPLCVVDRKDGFEVGGFLRGHPF